MILHSINKSSPQHESVQSCFSCIDNGDAIILIEDGVYLGFNMQGISVPEFTKYPVYALNKDALARGLQEQLSDCIQLIDYKKFVELSLQYSIFQAWY